MSSGRHRRGRRRSALFGVVCGVLLSCAIAIGATALALRPSAGPGPASAASSPAAVTTTVNSALELALSQYRWADSDRSVFHDAGATAVLTNGFDPSAALRTVVAHPQRGPGAAARVQAWAARTSTQSLTCAVVTAKRIGVWTLVVVRGVRQSVGAAVVARLSSRGTAAAVGDDDEADASLVVARAGRVVRAVDPVLGTSRVGVALPAERGLVFGVQTSLRAMSQALLVVARVTGVELSASELTGTSGAVAAGYCA